MFMSAVLASGGLVRGLRIRVCRTLIRQSRGDVGAFGGVPRQG